MGSIPIDSTYNSKYESGGSVAEYDSRPIEEDQNGARIRYGKGTMVLDVCSVDGAGHKQKIGISQVRLLRLLARV